MSTWVIISWVLVAILAAINVVVFLKLKGAAEQVMGSMFPGMKPGDAMAQMQKMMGGLQGMQGMRGGAPGGARGGDAQLKAAMQMLQQQQRGPGRGKR